MLPRLVQPQQTCPPSSPRMARPHPKGGGKTGGAGAAWPVAPLAAASHAAQVRHTYLLSGCAPSIHIVGWGAYHIELSRPMLRCHLSWPCYNREGHRAGNKTQTLRIPQGHWRLGRHCTPRRGAGAALGSSSSRLTDGFWGPQTPCTGAVPGCWTCCWSDGRMGSGLLLRSD